VDLFFKIISNELETLESGIRVENEWLKFYLLISIYDKPAKATMLNMKGSTGYFGCTQCEIEGESIQFQNGNHLIFKYTSKANLRTEQSYKDSLANLNNGVLGECILSKLRFYHPIKSNQIDVMHSICLGICKLFFVYWFNSCLVKSYCLKNHMDQKSKMVEKLILKRTSKKWSSTPSLLYKFLVSESVWSMKVKFN
jgi:hypothetical protein